MITYYSTGETAKKLNKSSEMIRQYIKQGKLKPDAYSGKEALFKEETIIDFQHRNKASNNGK